MKLKTLLLGSAAAMIAVSGARAADAVVAEPEPVEYVKVCDMYGAGYFYIPGTETCLKISGQVRVSYEYDGNGNNNNYSDNLDASTSSWGTRGRAQFEASNETDYGTLSSLIRVQGTAGDGGAGDFQVDRAFINLANLSFGFDDSHWSTFHGYGNLHDNYAGYYGFNNGNYVDYTYAANGFTAVIGLTDVADGANNAHVNLDYYAGLKYAGSWGNVAGTIVHEDITDDIAYKVSAQVSVIDGLQVKGWYVGGDATGGNYIQNGGDWAWGASASYAINSDLSFAVGYTDSDTTFDSEFVTVGAYWKPVAGLSVNGEVQLTDDGEAYSLRVYRSW